MSYSRTYSGKRAEEEVREGFNPDEPEAHNPEAVHNLDYPFTTEENGEEQGKDDTKPPVSAEAEHWETRDLSDAPDQEDSEGQGPKYASFREERDVWNDT